MNHLPPLADTRGAAYDRHGPAWRTLRSGRTHRMLQSAIWEAAQGWRCVVVVPGVSPGWLAACLLLAPCESMTVVDVCSVSVGRGSVRFIGYDQYVQGYTVGLRAKVFIDHSVREKVLDGLL